MTIQEALPGGGPLAAEAVAEAGVPGAKEPRRPFGRWFRETGWRHIIGIVMLVFAGFPLVYVLSASLNPGGTLLTANSLFANVDLGAYIATEATLSFLGIGLQPPAISWGIAISEASGLGYVRTAPHMLLFPSLFLSITVLSFIMLGEVVRDALDPKLR